jgi:Flp pilus assembly protein TadG
VALQRAAHASGGALARAARASRNLEAETNLQQAMNKMKNERGQTMTEFAFVLPILVVLMLGIVQFGVAFNNYVTLTDAVRAGARKAAVSRNSSDPEGDCKAQVIASAGALDTTDLATNLSCTSSWAPGAEVRVYADYGYDIKLLDWSVYSGRLKSEMRERVE